MGEPIDTEEVYRRGYADGHRVGAQGHYDWVQGRDEAESRLFDALVEEGRGKLARRLLPDAAVRDNAFEGVR